MKKILSMLLLSLVLILSACGSKDEKTEAAEVEKQSEMMEAEAANYLEQVTYRLFEADKEESGSFEQKSALQAAIGRSESMTEEIKEKYGEDLPIAEALIEIASLSRIAAEKALDGDHSRVKSGVLVAEMNIGEFSEDYLGGEVPLQLQQMLEN